MLIRWQCARLLRLEHHCQQVVGSLHAMMDGLHGITPAPMRVERITEAEIAHLMLVVQDLVSVEQITQGQGKHSAVIRIRLLRGLGLSAVFFLAD